MFIINIIDTVQDLVEDIKVLAEEFDVVIQKHTTFAETAQRCADNHLNEKNMLSEEIVELRTEMHAISERCRVLQSQTESAEQLHEAHVQHLEREFKRLQTEQQRIQACLEMAQDDNQSLLDQMKE
jgi:outer membrane protein assembly factor BamD (BamD/ComL family)